jgi:hypothetical protein
MNLTKSLIKEIRKFKQVPDAINFKFESLGITDFIKTLDLIYSKLSPDVFYLHIVDQGYNLYSLNDYDFIAAILKIYQSLLK